MMLRTIAEHLSRRVVLRRKLPVRVGGSTIFVSPDSSLKFWRHDLGKADPDIFNWAAEFVSPGDVVWDIGANVGLFAFAAANLAGAGGRVYAVEADTWLVGLLRRSSARLPGSCAAVDVFPVAISDSVGLVQFNIASRGRSANYLVGSDGSTQAGGVRARISVMSVTLDWLSERLPAPDVLKIDVEGAEDQVLEGGRRVLGEARPVILCEVAEKNTAKVSALLHSYGYALYDLEEKANPRLRKVRTSFNTLAVPGD